MSIAITTQSVPSLAPITPQPAQGPVQGGGFEQLLGDVNGILERADQMAAGYAQGKVGLTEAVLSANQADTTFGLVVGVRNRALSAYQEIMNMQV
jgi:flagellar hook-basal body complex protein FliE